MEPLTVERSIWINAPRERVWRAITETEQIMRWWNKDDRWEIPALRVGETIKFIFGNPVTVMLATIDVVEPPHKFSLLWPPQPQYHNLRMVLTYVLTEENGGTRVTVSETGFEALPDAVRQERFEKTGAGYTIVLHNLKTLLEQKTSS
ncbi:MAG: SRPBCC domain-containing protein [Anaerolineae bacterium]